MIERLTQRYHGSILQLRQPLRYIVVQPQKASIHTLHSGNASNQLRARRDKVYRIRPNRLIRVELLASSSLLIEDIA